MVRPGRDNLQGVVEVDETYVGGKKPGKRGRGAEGKELVVIAVEDKGSEGIGRIRLAHLPDASSSSLHSFVEEMIRPGAVVRTMIGQDMRGSKRRAINETLPRLRR